MQRRRKKTKNHPVRSHESNGELESSMERATEWVLCWLVSSKDAVVSFAGVGSFFLFFFRRRRCSVSRRLFCRRRPRNRPTPPVDGNAVFLFRDLHFVKRPTLVDAATRTPASHWSFGRGQSGEKQQPIACPQSKSDIVNKRHIHWLLLVSLRSGKTLKTR